MRISIVGMVIAIAEFRTAIELVVVIPIIVCMIVMDTEEKIKDYF